MKNALLVPTDFSDNAWTAVRYAIHLALKFGWDVHLLHVYQTMRRSLAGTEFNDVMESHAEDRAESAMMDLLQRIKGSDLDVVAVTTACLAGDLCHIVLNMIESNTIKLIVMGTKGASGIKHVTLGSNTFELIQKSPIGVLAVPESYEGFQLEKIGLLANFKDAEIRLLQAFISRTSSAVDVVMLHVEEARRKQDQYLVDFWVNNVQDCSQVRSICYRSNETVKRFDFSLSIPHGINKLIEEEKIDLLLVSYNRKSFFRLMFSKSLTKEIAHNLSVPAYFKREGT